MNVSGLSSVELAFIDELQEMEKALLDINTLCAPDVIAQGLTCLAHDYVQLGLEEKGHELLIKADEIYPGYHSSKMEEHMESDPDFKKLVLSLSAELILVALSVARDGK